ncbi:MAG TPA: 16S rRNA (cytosine(1402)-N(4))-methyltransferase RsmH [Rhodothermales bacterium]|nr:16S rRNA (cytosine(1402)-N(4))-methyltransferase RsmH [Rhodothermales bacterium]
MTENDNAQGGSSDPMRYATAYHAPVLCNTVIEGLVTDREGLYVDATLGGGGHSVALLNALAPAGRVVGIDQDAEALAEASKRLADEVERGRFQMLRGNFGDLERLLSEAGITAIDGLLLDLGVSSHQLDEAERGFSYQAEGELDMRMNTQSGVSADEVVNHWREEELRQVLWDFGEEKRGRQVARAIVAARPIATTTELADVIRSAVPTRDEVKTLARVFQGIRIAVNAEMEKLEAVLEAAVEVIRPGGRIAVIAYHSLEDRPVKRFLRYGNLRGEPVRDIYGNLLTPWGEITRKPVMAGEEEVEANPRARSARLRIAERIAEHES